MTNRIHNFLGFEFRANLWEIHHFYHGVVGSLISLYGLREAIEMLMYGFATFNIPIYVLGILVVLIQLSALAVWVYVAKDDVQQHVAQVADPDYHSPVHNWFHEMYKYPAVAWFTKKADAVMANPLLVAIILVIIIYLCVR